MLAACLLALFGGLASVTAYKVFTGQIRCTGLLSNHPGGPPTPERVQALFIGVLAIGGYALNALESMSHANVSALPEVPTYFLEIFGTSQLLFVVGKYLRNR